MGEFNSKSRCNSVGPRDCQRGAALLVSLVVLLIITVLGMSVLETTTLEEKMAASARNKDLALQSAERALIKAEDLLRSAAPVATDFTVDCTGTSGSITSGLCLLPNSVGGNQRWEDTAICSGQNVWDGGCSYTLTGVTGVAAQPKFIVEFLKTVEVGGDRLQQGNLQDIPMGTLVNYYRITSLGFGGSADARVMLQSTFSL